MINEIKYGQEARKTIQKGIDALANAVAVTMGPKGRNVVIKKPYSKAMITKDGVTVANAVQLSDPIENIAAEIIKEVAAKTAEIAGDGTTTATVLAQSIIKEGMLAIEKGLNPIDLKRGLDEAKDVVVKFLKDHTFLISKNKEKIQQVATISTNNDKSLGDIIGSAIFTIGRDGAITSEVSKNSSTYINIVEGMKFDRGYISPNFINNQEKMHVELDSPFIFLFNGKIESLESLLNVLQEVIASHKSLLIVCEDINGEALSILTRDTNKANLKMCVVKIPAFGEKKKFILEDIAILTQGTVISEDSLINLDSVKLANFGRADKIIVTKDSTTIMNGMGSKEDIEARIYQIKNTIQNVDSPKEIENLQERIAKLSGGVAVIYVGATTEIEMKEKKDRVDDALYATRAAVEEGIVPGGGTALLKSIMELVRLNKDNNEGWNILKNALLRPYTQILSNAGLDSSKFLNEILDLGFEFGFNCNTEQVENLIISGVIDPTKVTRVALENAVSIAGTILTTDCLVAMNISNETNLI